mgnify:CR=1 FL=1
MEIKKEILEEINNNYIQGIENKTVRCALVNNKIRNIMRNKEKEGKLLFNFSLNLDTLRVVDQKNSGNSFIYAGCNVLRESICKKYNLEDFELSQSFISFYDKLEKCNYIMECLVQLKDRDIDDRERYHLLTKGVQDGGQWDLFVNIINKYGIVPKTVMSDTYQSYNPSEVNHLLNRKLRQFNAKILSNKDNLQFLKSLYLDEIYRILASCYGLPPKQFDFEYTDKDKKYHIIKDITPLQFYLEYTDIDVNDYVCIINAPTKDKPLNKTYTVKYLGNVIEGNKVLYLNLSIEELKKLVIKQLQAKEVVFLGCDIEKAMDEVDGVFDDMSFNYYDTFKTDFFMTKEEVLDNYESTINHTVVITGVNLDGDRTTKWKIENSFGDKVGNKGYFVASDTWFDKYAYQVVINKKYLSQEQLEELKLEPIELKPWDPFGTLA